MFKRANKITSLLVAAAAVASMVPAYAADVKKVDSQDGTVYNAVAYNGKFYVDADVNDKEAAYYVDNNGKYTEIADVDSGSDISTYGTKYVDVNDGDYFVDLTTGKSTDDSIADDARDDAASNLRKKVKADTDGRYVKDGLANAADGLQTFTSSNEISGNKFGEVWYATSLVNKDATNGLTAKTTAGVAGTLNVFTDGSGNYIDADYNLGKIKVDTTTGSATKTVYVENTDDTYDTANTGNVAAKVAQTKVIGQDKDYIYRFANVTVYTTGSTATIAKIDGHSVATAAAGVFNTTTPNAVSFDVLQKISKAQSSGDIGGVKYAKTVYTYLLTDDSDNLANKSSFATYTNYSIADGKVIGYNFNSTAKSADIQTATLKSTNGLYYTDLGSSSTGDDTEAVQVDVSGNVYRLNGGYIYQWNNDEDWDKIYKVDGSFDKFSVYDKSNIIAWNQDDEVYSVIGGKKAEDKKDDTAATTTTTATTTTKVTGWVKNTDGTWTFNKADGSKATGWYQDATGAWYFSNANGIMLANAWTQDSAGNWYYLGASGAMLTNTTTPDGYYVGANGAWV